MLEINFWVWSSAGSVGLKFSGPSAKLLITLIIFNFFRSDPLSSTYFDSRFNSPKENRYRPSKRNYKSPHLVSHSGFQLFQVEPRLSIWKRMPSTLLPVRFWNVCLWQFFVCFNAFTTFWYYTKKNFMYFSESDTFTRPEDHWEWKLFVVRFFYLFWTSGRPWSSSTDCHNEELEESLF